MLSEHLRQSLNYTGTVAPALKGRLSALSNSDLCSEPFTARDVPASARHLLLMISKEANEYSIEFSSKLRGARSRLYRRRFVQVNTRWKALAEIYTMHSFAPFFNLKISANNRQHFFAIE